MGEVTVYQGELRVIIGRGIVAGQSPACTKPERSPSRARLVVDKEEGSQPATEGTGRERP